jgi:hypothetical protein
MPDSFVCSSTVAVGRAPVHSEAQARADKVIAYEKLRTKTGARVPTGWLSRHAIAADYWDHGGGGDLSVMTMKASGPPAAGQIARAAGADWAVAQLPSQLDPSATPGWRLVMTQDNADVEVPFDPTANSTRLGWYYCAPGASSPPAAVASKTTHIAVRGPKATLEACKLWFWDRRKQDDWLVRAAGLRVELLQFPNHRSLRRLYRDWFDVSDGASVEGLHTARFQGLLAGGVHLLTVCAHATPDPWWFFGASSKQDAAAKFAPGVFPILFANSCSTARPDFPGAATHAVAGTTPTTDASYANAPSIGCAFVREGGRAPIVYVGNTRWGWSVYADARMLDFFARLRKEGRPGVAATVVAPYGADWFWTHHTQVFLGDPEMPAWVDGPRDMQILAPKSVSPGRTFGLFVQHRFRSYALPVRDARVTITAGWKDSTRAAALYASKLTDANGYASFSLPSAFQHASVTVCAVRSGYLPIEGLLHVDAT